MLIGLQSVQEEYNDYIQIKTTKRKLGGASHVDENEFAILRSQKGGGSTSNGRDSQSKRLGAKRADGQTVSGGSIAYRQRGTKNLPRGKRRYRWR